MKVFNVKKNPPLTGLKVLELARVLAGPWAGQLLADLGAEVIKIESPNGDETRHWGPPFHGKNSSAYFQSTNRGKKSVIANLSNKDDCNMVKKLALKADVLIENFKVSGLKKYNLDYSSIKKGNPSIIYCSITGFGQNGPSANKPGYDFIIQAMGGIMDLTGERTGEPQKPGIAYADLFTGLYSVVAIQSALLSRKSTGTGTHIDMSLFDTQIGVLANQGASYLKTGVSPTRMGNSHPVIVPYQKFNVNDGSIIIACGNDEQFEKLCIALGWSFYKETKYKKNKDRVVNRMSLVPLMQARLSSLSQAAVLLKLDKAGVPSGAINSVAEALADKQALHREMVYSINGQSAIRSPILFDTISLKYKDLSPELGQHTEEIKQNLNNRTFWKTKN